MSLLPGTADISRQAPGPVAAVSCAILHIRGGDTLVVGLDAEHGSYLHAEFERRFNWFERRGGRRFTWFETTDGILVGVDLGAVSAIRWVPPGVGVPPESPLDHDHLMLRFSDGKELQMSQIAADDIYRLRGATICDRGRNPLQLAECATARITSIRAETLLLATLPARWLDADAG